MAQKVPSFVAVVPTGPFDSSTGGTVNVGGCGYVDDSEKQLTQEAQDIQDQLRDAYDTCH